MTKKIVDDMDARLLDAIQREFPLCAAPFEELGRRLGIGTSEVLGRIERLKREAIIRQISAIFDSAGLGYRSSLVAFRVEERLLDLVAEAIAAHRGVSHCYSRDADFNLWFTITVPTERDIEPEVSGLARLDGVAAHLVLPALRVFKIGVFLAMSDDAPEATSASRHRVRPAAPLTEPERAAVRALQKDLPLVERPFGILATEEGLSEDLLLDFARRFIERGVMRRFAAVLRHTRAGYRVNAMVCWRVPIERVSEIGEALAAHPSVSHCYERPVSPDWPYPLYTMVHCRTEEELERAIGDLSAAAQSSDHIVLRSVKEYKKSRVSYFQDSER